MARAAYDFLRDLVTPADVCAVCDDAFGGDEGKVRQCRADCEADSFGALNVECANPWYEVFRDRSKTVCVDGNVFVLQIIILYLAILVAFML